MSKLIVNEIEKYDAGQLTITTGTDVSIGSDLTVGGSIAGTLSTAAQANITSVGTLSSLAVASSSSAIATFTSTAAASALSIDNTNANLWGSNIEFKTNNVAKGYIGTIGSLIGNTDQDLTMYASGGLGVRFYTNGNNERMRIDSSGNVGMNAIAENSAGVWRNYQLGSLSMSGRSVSSVPGSFFGTNFKFTTANAEQRISAHATSRIYFNDDTIIFQNAGADSAGSNIGWSEAARFNPSGNMVFPNGNGIDFSASAGGGATSSLLDDYEEGTWTPAWNFETSGSVTASSGLGYYTKIGRQVTATVYFFTTSTSSPVGTATLSGLPYVPNPSVNDQSVTIGLKRLWGTDMPNLTAVINPSNQRVNFLYQASNQTLTTLSGSDFNTAGTSNILAITATYFTS